MKRFKRQFLLENPLAALVAGLQLVRKKTLLDYRLFPNGFSLYPSTIIFHPTARCNLRCKMCVIDSYFFPRELSLARIKKIIDQVAFFKPHFYLAGGEPLLRKDLESIIRHAKKKGLIVTLTTNGVLLDKKRARRLVNSGIDGVSVSIDGPKKINDQIRGQGNFEKATRALGFLRELRAKQGRFLPKLKIATVISGFSFPYLEEMADLADSLGVDEINFLYLDHKTQVVAQAHQACLKKLFGQAVDCLGYVIHAQAKKEEKQFINIDPGVVKKQVQGLKAGKRSVSVSFAPPVGTSCLNDYFSGKYFKDFACTNPWFSATILPNGDLVPCFSFKIGNLLETDFKNLWNNQVYKKFRQSLKEKGHFPGCLHCCGTTDVQKD